MYKAKVNNLCQNRSWSLPDYQTNREGTLHNPCFTSTVTINGLQFHSPEPTRTAKQAQNNAAKLAFDHFSRSLGSPGPNNGGGVDVDNDSTVTSGHKKDMLHVFKNQLQNYAQKRKLDLPVYSPEWEGPSHALRFKCKVTVDGQTFESPNFFSTLKDAEQAAAQVALMSLSPGGVQEDQTWLYKNLLQELVHKEAFHLTSYNTNIYGEAHMPIFVSQVEIEGEVFTGQEAKSKKRAEMNAAKVAYMALKERKGMSDQSSLFPLSAHHGQAPEFSSDCSEANVIAGLQHHANLKSPAEQQPGKANFRSLLFQTLLINHCVFNIKL